MTRNWRKKKIEFRTSKTQNTPGNGRLHTHGTHGTHGTHTLTSCGGLSSKVTSSRPAVPACRWFPPPRTSDPITSTEAEARASKASAYFSTALVCDDRVRRSSGLFWGPLVGVNGPAHNHNNT